MLAPPSLPLARQRHNRARPAPTWQRIRTEALQKRPLPCYGNLFIGDEPIWRSIEDRFSPGHEYDKGTDTERRMFLLFVAEAL